MAKIIAVMDTESKTLELTIDGSMVPDIASVNLERYSNNEESYVEFYANSHTKDGKIVKNTRYYTSADKVVTAKDVDVKQFINSKKSHKSI